MLCFSLAQGVCWFGDDACGKRDLRALAHWTQILPFMMLFHVCEGHDMQAIMQVSLFATSVHAKHNIVSVHTTM